MRRLSLALLVGALPTSASAGPCQYHHDLGLFPEVLTPDGATLDQTGGVVVAARGSPMEGGSSQDPTPQDWKFGVGKTHEIGARTVIAPGLVVVAPADIGHDLVFENVDKTPVRKLHFQKSKTAVAPAAPTLVSASFKDKDLGIMVREATYVELKEAPPPDAVALVIYAGDKARSWTAVPDAKSTHMTIYAVDDCVMAIPGSMPTRAGDKITAAWLDSNGHLSARSKEITVAH